VPFTRRPSSVTTVPLTLTRPAAMRSSETRREATPAAAMSFWRRMPSAAASPPSCRSGDAIEAFGSVVEQRRDVRELIERVDAELAEQQVCRLVVDGPGLAVGVRLGHESAPDERA